MLVILVCQQCKKRMRYSMDENWIDRRISASGWQRVQGYFPELKGHESMGLCPEHAEHKQAQQEARA